MIDYDLKKIRAFVFDVDGVLSPSTIPMGVDGVPSRMVNIKDGYALQLAARHGYKIAIISGAVSDAICKRYNALHINDIYVGASMKLPILKEWMERNGLQREEVAYVGDDIPDIECLREAGLSVAPADAAIDVLPLVKYVSPFNGGYGVARDLIEQVMKAQGEWMSSEKAFGW